MPRAEPSRTRTPSCRTCRHYHVTWDTARPHGCRAYEFKSAALPSRLVFELSGVRCQLHEPRPAAGRRRRP